jgi:hypothetical protein
MNGKDSNKKYVLTINKNSTTKTIKTKTIFLIEIENEMLKYYKQNSNKDYLFVCEIDKKSYDSFDSKMFLFSKKTSVKEIIKCLKLEHYLI